MRVYRIVKAHRAATAFDGLGAQAAPGRWNSAGVRMVYTAASRALAMLEILVHLEAADLLAATYVTIAADIPDACIMPFKGPLPSDWQASPAGVATRQIGDRWIADAASVALAVPSVVIPAELNYLINPAHPDWRRVRLHEPEPLAVDPRLGG